MNEQIKKKKKCCGSITAEVRVEVCGLVAIEGRDDTQGQASHLSPYWWPWDMLQQGPW